MEYVVKENLIEAIRKYADIKHRCGEQIEYINGILKSISVIKEQPHIGVEEVKHGYWEHSLYCSVCGYLYDTGEHTNSHNYCPRCGARMDGEGV